MFSDLFGDVVYAFRKLLKNPGFTAVAVLTLALGIGANTTVFSVVEAILNFPIPMDDPERIAFVFSENSSRNLQQQGVSMEDFLDWRGQSQSFEYLVAGDQAAYNFASSGEPERVVAFRFSAGFFPLTGNPPVLGRSFSPEESAPGAERVTILSHSFWQQRFGGDPGVLGRQILLDGLPHTVVGVAPEGFFFGDPATALWTPLVLERGRTKRDDRSLFVMARLRPGVTVEQANAEMEILARRLEQTHADTNDGWTARVQTVRDNLVTGAGMAMIVLYVSISFVLLIACANVANLQLARATVREKEMALRTALGAGRGRLVKQLLTESLLLGFIGGVLGLAIGVGGIRLLRNMLAPDVNIGFLANVMELNTWVLAHTVVLSLLAGLVTGMAPAIQSSRSDPAEALKEGGRSGGGGSRRGYLRSALVVAQVAMALALLSAAGALIRAFEHIYTTDPGFHPKNLLTMQLALPEATYPEPDGLVTFYREALDRIASLPGVESAAATSLLPLTLLPGAATTPVIVEGRESSQEDAAPTAVELVVSPSYFETMGVPIVEGRAITEQDDEDSLRVTVVSRAAAQRYWPGTSPLGRRLKLGDRDSTEPWLTVVGVSKDVQTHAHSLRNPRLVVAHVFLPLAQSPRRTTAIALRTRVEPASLAPAIREAIWEIDPDQPVDRIMPMGEVIARIDTQNIFFIRILSGLAVIALLLAAVGIYGVISYSVNQRTNEIGIRMAMGAQPRNILLMIVRQGAMLAGVGLPLGLLAALAIVRFMGSQLEGLGISHASGPLTFVAVSLILLAVANLASYLPARRAVQVDPVVALRYE